MAQTPILDLQCEPPAMRRSWAPILVGVLIGLALVRWVSIDGLTWFPVLIISIAIHEIGHVAAGKLAGMKPGGIVVCGLMILKSGDRWLCRFDVRRLLSGGVAKPLPAKHDFDPRRYAWMVAGGPIATLLLLAVSGIAYWRSAGPAGLVNSFWWINLTLFLGVLIPTDGVNKSDGARLWLLLHDPEDSRSWIAFLQLLAEETVGVLPRYWDSEMFAGMMQYRPGSSDGAYRELLAFYRRIDERNVEGALEHFEKALAATGRGGRLLRHACFLEAVCASAILRANPAAARTWLARATRVRKPMSRHGPDAAIAQSEGRYADAIGSWDAALAFVVARKFDSGLARFGKAKIIEYREQCQEAIGAARIASAAQASAARPTG